MSIRNKTVAGTTAAGLPKRNINGSNPPNAPEPGTVSNQRSQATPPPASNKPAEIQGPANGPDVIQG